MFRHFVTTVCLFPTTLPDTSRTLQKPREVSHCFLKTLIGTFVTHLPGPWAHGCGEAWVRIRCQTTRPVQVPSDPEMMTTTGHWGWGVDTPLGRSGRGWRLALEGSDDFFIFLGMRRKHLAPLGPLSVLSPTLLLSHLTPTLALHTKRKWQVTQCPLSPWSHLPLPQVLPPPSPHTKLRSSHRPPTLA